MNYIFLSITLITATLAFSQNNPLVGTWVVDEYTDSIILELTKEGVFYLSPADRDETFGGIHQYSKEYTENDSVFLDHKYTIDMSSFPHKLTLTAYFSGTDSFCYILPMVFRLKEDTTFEAMAYEEGILRENKENPEPILKEFYATTAKFDTEEFDLMVFKRLK